VAVWDGVPKGKDAKAGTAVDVANWRRANGRARVIPPTWQRSAAKPAQWPPNAPKLSKLPKDGDEVTRELRAMIFTDFRGFTKLEESVLPIFWKQVMRRMMRVLDRYEGAICYRNTWGDALYAVVVDTRHAAAIALELQDSLRDVDYAALGIDSEPHMRVGAHYGPVFRAGGDGALNYYGTQVSRTARIEPIAPPGAVYVTEQFAAVLAMEAPDAFVCRYVGPVQLAKGYGALRMYLLTRRN
jgi:class 3 adenylate cyclase